MNALSPGSQEQRRKSNREYAKRSYKKLKLAEYADEADEDDGLPAAEAFGRRIGGKARPAAGSAVRSAKSRRSSVLAAAIERILGGPAEQAAALQYTLESKLPAVAEALPLSSSSCPFRRARRRGEGALLARRELVQRQHGQGHLHQRARDAERVRRRRHARRDTGPSRGTYMAVWDWEGRRGGARAGGRARVSLE